MDHIDLFALREHFNQRRIMLCFNGPISRSLIEEIGNALKNYLQADNARPSVAMDVFGVYIEMTQNIRHYATALDYDEITGLATVTVARTEDGHYMVKAGNLVEEADGNALLARVEALAAMDKAQLKAAYKEQLRKPREKGVGSGAGLGLLDMARKSAEPMTATLAPVTGGRHFFSLCAVI